MATTVTEYPADGGWQQLASAAGEYLIEVTTDYFYAYGSAAPAANQIGYNGARGIPLAIVVVSGSGFWVRPRGINRLSNWSAVVTGASQ